MATENETRFLEDVISRGDPMVPRPTRAWIIPPERLPEALERHKSTVEFVEALESLEIGVAPPAMHFDPTWEDK